MTDPISLGERDEIESAVKVLQLKAQDPWSILKDYTPELKTLISAYREAERNAAELAQVKAERDAARERIARLEEEAAMYRAADRSRQGTASTPKEPT